MSDFKEIRVVAPIHDADVIIELPGGEEITVQLRPSNADENYNGSLDVILPHDTSVVCWKGDDMEDSPQDGNKPNCRIAKQLVCELPGDYDGAIEQEIVKGADLLP